VCEGWEERVYGHVVGRVMSWDESLAIMKVLDEIRRISDLKYLERIESVINPLPGLGI